MTHFDVVIIGGGLAGLNCALNLPKLNVLVLEKRDVGGRIYTHKDANMVVEAGAARFHHGHKRLFKLLREFRLVGKITPLPPADPVYLDTGDPTATYGDVKRILDAVLRSSKNPSIHHTFLEHAALIVGKSEVDLLKKGFGYTAELTIMNARDALNLVKELSGRFYTLQGGLSQLVDKMAKKINVVNEEVLDVSYKGSFQISTAKRNYTSTVCISCVQKPNLERFTVAKPLSAKLQHIKSAPLCRIYANIHFPEKIYTNSDLKMIIPISETVAMVSYTDSKYADKWKKIKDAGGDQAVNAQLKTLLGELDLPTTFKNVNLFYWPHGVGYWGVGANSQKLERDLLHPFAIPFFICGENFSASHQQWMEGALETSDKVVGMVKQWFRMRKTRKKNTTARV